MRKKSGFDFMFNFVQEYLDGTMDRLGWDLNFNHYLIKEYPKMERENPQLADCFNFYLAEEGFDLGEDLNDTEHKKLLCKQWCEFNAILKDGIY